MSDNTDTVEEAQEIDWKHLYQQVVADNEKLREERTDWILRDGQEIFSWETAQRIIRNPYFIGALWGALIICILLYLFLEDDK